jgi:hypothetical protein
LLWDVKVGSGHSKRTRCTQLTRHLAWTGRSFLRCRWKIGCTLDRERGGLSFRRAPPLPMKNTHRQRRELSRGSLKIGVEHSPKSLILLSEDSAGTSHTGFAYDTQSKSFEIPGEIPATALPWGSYGRDSPAIGTSRFREVTLNNRNRVKTIQMTPGQLARRPSRVAANIPASGTGHIRPPNFIGEQSECQGPG